ncbi:hypothetical protein [Trinickia fusca]|nr:hypothetical protein [Trinickia fusca]
MTRAAREEAVLSAVRMVSKRGGDYEEAEATRIEVLEEPPLPVP